MFFLCNILLYSCGASESAVAVIIIVTDCFKLSVPCWVKLNEADRQVITNIFLFKIYVQLWGLTKYLANKCLANYNIDTNCYSFSVDCVECGYDSISIISIHGYSLKISWYHVELLLLHQRNLLLSIVRNFCELPSALTVKLQNMRVEFPGRAKQ